MSALMDSIKPRGKYLSLSKLKEVGDSYKITVTDHYTERQQTDFHTKEPIFSKSGKPITELLVPGKNWAAETEEDADSILVLDKWRARQAVARAVQEAGGDDLRPGGTLTITYTGLGPKGPNAIQAPKDFSAEYEAPAPLGGEWGSEED